MSTTPDQIPTGAVNQDIQNINKKAIELMVKIKFIISQNLPKMYANKKIFIPVVSFFGLVFLIIILGVLFGKKGVPGINTPTPTPTPFTIESNTSTISGTLNDAMIKLNNLKDQINNLDVKQGRLQPPTLDFDIRF